MKNISDTQEMPQSRSRAFTRHQKQESKSRRDEEQIITKPPRKHAIVLDSGLAIFGFGFLLEVF